MIHFDDIIFFKWVETQPPPRYMDPGVFFQEKDYCGDHVCSPYNPIVGTGLGLDHLFRVHV